jgi:hypothetical protein
VEQSQVLLGRNAELAAKLQQVMRHQGCQCVPGSPTVGRALPLIALPRDRAHRACTI